MASKILKANGEVVPRPNLRALMLEEREYPAHIELRLKLSESYETVLGLKSTPVDFTPDKLTPEWELYKNYDRQERTDDVPTEEL